MDILKSRFDAVNAQMNEFYELKFASDADEYKKNKEIKSNIVQLLVDAKSNGDLKVCEDAIDLLFDNTGCQEDFEILEELLRPLLAKGVIDSQLLDNRLKQSPLSRWS